MVHPDDRERAPQRSLLTDSTLVPGLGGAGGSGGVARVFGGRYELRGVLGRGGMGEVWLARDLKLQVEVALKALTAEKLGDEAAMARLRAEVRSARAVASPHVCRVYDLIEAEGVECVSMEYIDGTTLRQVLDTRGPLELGEAREIALQLLAGLGAIHEAGLVHRDVKPENVMITRSGRVVLMDFGIAKAVATGGTVAGTPAYWAPEQAAGEAADPRADVYATGIVLAEMVAPGMREWDRRQALWEALRDDPARVPDTPWSEVIAKAVAREPDKRYPSAQSLARALEEVAHRVTGIEEAQPYPGLAAFTEADAEYFFGREAEVEGVWKRLPKRHLLALVGPSGAGKSSFLRAGLIPAKPAGWAHLICTPGDAPFVALGQALVPEVSRDTDAMRQMLRFEDADVAVELFRHWLAAHTEALVIVDQLEELFTLNPAEVQARFATLLSRLALEADVHVLLSMRDDFLLRCQEHEVLRPVFEGLVPLGPPTGDALRRALVQPALKCGYRFEDEALVGEMLQVVEGERGALPLLAFAAASVWERRDRDNGLLTRAAHESIGGVAGALARHAEATLERIGTEKLPLVRELFRNLVTAQGTRAVRDVDELLTVFPEYRRAEAEGILRTLIDARLLTSYEAHATEPGQTAGRRVEVVHESLLTAWPRLVRWHTEDEGSAQLRDQLRQAAHLWEEKGRPEDLLWTGTSYQEYQVWRSRYPGGLSEVEETFARAMATAAGRKRRRRRIAFAAVLGAVALVAMALGILLRRSVRETHKREAAQLLALGMLRLDEHPNAALAWAIASLETADNAPARRFALEALWHGPPALYVRSNDNWTGAWSADGRWLAVGTPNGAHLLERDSGAYRRLSQSQETILGFTSDSRRLVTRDEIAAQATVVLVRSLPGGEIERTLRHEEKSGTVLTSDDRLVTFTGDASIPSAERPRLLRRLSLDGVTEQVLGRWEPHGLTSLAVDPSGRWLFSLQGGRVLQQPLDALATPPRVIGTHAGDARVTADTWRDRVVTGDITGEVRIWDVPGARLVRTLKSPADGRLVATDPSGRFLATDAITSGPFTSGSLVLFDLSTPGSPEPVPVLAAESAYVTREYFSPDGRWLATFHEGLVTLWNVAAGPRSHLLGRETPPLVQVAFTRDGQLLSASNGVLRSRSLSHAPGEAMRELWSRPGAVVAITGEQDPSGRFVVMTDTREGSVVKIPNDGSSPSKYPLAHPEGTPLTIGGGFLDPTGRFVAVPVSSPRWREERLKRLRILDLFTGEERSFDTDAARDGRCTDAEVKAWGGVDNPLWLPDGSLLSDGPAGMRLWDIAAGTSALLQPCDKASPAFMLATPDSRSIVRLGPYVEDKLVPSWLSVFDLASRRSRDITSHGSQLWSMDLDPSGTVLVTGDKSGLVRVGPLTGEEPRLLYGHSGAVSVAVSPDGRWIASASDDDGTIRLWPMPDLSKPPLHILPHDELLAKLKSLTNLRAVRDPSSDTGWKIEVGSFPGWKDVPEWNP